MMKIPEHGGRLNAAARRWGIPPADWLDLSTGINPTPWPVPPVPMEVWQRLPEPDDGLEDEIRLWSGAPTGAGVLGVPGSQAAIQVLPSLRPRCRVAIPMPGYREHAYRWARAGHVVTALTPDQMLASDDWLADVDVVVWIQPNNPTGHLVAPDRLAAWHRVLTGRGGWLIVDEAFVPGHDHASLASRSGQQGLIILRSMGKFFGLAGLRAGAVLGPAELIARLEESLGLWALSGPARYLMARALADTRWQQAMGSQLEDRITRLERLLARAGLEPSGRTLLFVYVLHEDARVVADDLARQGILVRCFEAPSALRIGLPGEPSQWRRLEQALAGLPGH